MNPVVDGENNLRPSNQTRGRRGGNSDAPRGLVKLCSSETRPLDLEFPFHTRWQP